MKRLLVLVVLFCWTETLCSQALPCVPIRPPMISEASRVDLEKKLLLAIEEYKKDTSDAESLIWYGRRLAYLGRYMEAIDVFTLGMKTHPSDARFYRHRGHRYITVRCFDRAIKDLEYATRLIKNKPDQVEPDGLPNAKNIPTSTLHSNIWYHLGLAHYLKGDFVKASSAYRQGLKVSGNPDMYVATANWYYITLRVLHKDKKASRLIKKIDSSMDSIENRDYLDLLMLYKEDKSTDDARKLLTQSGSTLSNSTRGFGFGNFFLLKGDLTTAKQIFETVITGDQWASFGFMATESALIRLDLTKK